MPNSERTIQFAISIAHLRMQIHGTGVDTDIVPPVCHRRFVVPFASDSKQIPNRSRPAGGARLNLMLVDDHSPHDTRDAACLWQSENWELWQDRDQNFVFISHQDGQYLRIIIDAGFTNGEIRGDYSGLHKNAAYPLENLGIIIYINWLANFGDIMLHASGVAIDGNGYCFLGDSGAGKSTLVRALLPDERITVLGEDQVIIRLIEDRFWIFGTPWHTDPALCSPIGVPLMKLFFLDRTLKPQLVPVQAADGVTRILQTAFVPYYRSSALNSILENLALLSEKVPFRLLSYQIGTDLPKAILEN